VAQGEPDWSSKLKLLLVALALTGALIMSWQIQDIHLGWGYAFGLFALMVAFFVTVDELTKETNK
jgi:hypothetical protein